MVVGPPVVDGFLDVFGFEVLGEGLAEECGELVIGGEAESYELTNTEVLDVGVFRCGQERGEAETLFEANDAVLRFEGRVARELSDEEQDNRHDDPPEMAVLV